MYEKNSTMSEPLVMKLSNKLESASLLSFFLIGNAHLAMH